MTKIDTILLDRDGTLIEERHYLKDPDLVALIPGTACLQRQGKGRLAMTYSYILTRYVSGQSYIEIFQSVLWGFFTRSKKPQSIADYILSGYLLLSAITLLFAYLELWSRTNYYPSPCFQIFLHRLLPPGVYCSRQVFLNPNLSLAILF